LVSVVPGPWYVAPVAGRTVQGSGAVPTVAQNWPTGHSTHVLGSVAPSATEYMPTLQNVASSNEVAAVRLPYFPGGNGTHLDASVDLESALYVPGAHATALEEMEGQ
jgi:hypothetical protein